MRKVARSVRERFEEKFIPEPNSGCWLWTAVCKKKGYGLFGMGRSMRLAHRVSFDLYVGEIPDGMFVCHKCDTPACVNPDHLFLGTVSDNARDMVNKGRQSRGEKHGHLTKQGAARGDSHCNSKLTEANVVYIRAQRGVISQIALASELGVSPTAIGEAQRGKWWRSVSGAK